MNPNPYIVELDFNMGNIRSLQKAFEYLGQSVEVSSDPQKLKKADALLLPGDGAFKQAMKEIRSLGLYDGILEHVGRKKPLLGICIGFQILFSGSEEFGESEGFSFFEGKLKKLNTQLPLPHIGWSQTEIMKRDSILTKNISNHSFFYYVHSYALTSTPPPSETTATCAYGECFTAIIEKDNLFGVQFHPEKSQKTGLHLLQNFLSIF